MGRNPSSDKGKAKCRKGLWSPDEDERLTCYILQHGHGCWGSLPLKAGIQRNGKSCRLRWINYLRPGLKRGVFTPQEEEVIMALHRTLGNKWSQIAQHLPGRTDNDIKNHWHSYLKKNKVEVESEEGEEVRQLTKPSTVNPVTRVVSFKSLVSQEGSPLASSESRQSPLSRLLFTEWLTMDNNISGDHQSVYSNPNEVYTSSNSFDFEMQGNNVYNQDTSSSICNMFSDILNEPEIKLEGEEHDSFEFVDSIFGDEIYNDFFGSNILMHTSTR